MTDHYFENEFVNLHYYKYGSGPKTMLCFHGYGMHGKQFKILESSLGEKYTFYGFDLFFHKETRLKDQSLWAIKKGITKKELAALVVEFCRFENIDRFSVIAYSMGTHYATVVTEELGDLVDEYIVAAPSCLNPGRVIPFFSRNKLGNKVLEKLTLHKSALINMLKLFKGVRIINSEAYNILYKEIGTPELRFNCYACFTYLRFFDTNNNLLLKIFDERNIKTIFIFGKRDQSFPPGIGQAFIDKIKNAEVVILDEGHEMIKRDFVNALNRLLL